MWGGEKNEMPGEWRMEAVVLRREQPWRMIGSQVAHCVMIRRALWIGNGLAVEKERGRFSSSRTSDFQRCWFRVFCKCRASSFQLVPRRSFSTRGAPVGNRFPEAHERTTTERRRLRSHYFIPLSRSRRLCAGAPDATRR